MCIATVSTFLLLTLAPGGVFFDRARDSILSLDNYLYELYYDWVSTLDICRESILLMWQPFG